MINYDIFLKVTFTLLVLLITFANATVVKADCDGEPVYPETVEITISGEAL